MEYESPTLDLVGSASTMIQAYIGPQTDGDAYLNSWGWGFTCNAEEE